MKSKIEREEEQDKLRIAMERKNKNTDTYYAKYWKSHPFIANAI